MYQVVEGTRSQQASDARLAVMQRSAAIRKIEQDLISVAELSQEVAELVHQQEYSVIEIERGADSLIATFNKRIITYVKGL